MSWTQERFEALVQRAEQHAKRNPAAYRRRVVGLAALGYGYLVLIVIVFALATVASAYLARSSLGIGAKLLLATVPLLFVVLRALWVRLTPPEGEHLSRREAPELFSLLDRLRRRLVTPQVHHVLVTPELNAGVVQLPRLGVFGWHSNYLLIGLPLLKSLTAQQLEAVLAHELGHLSHGDARIGNWIYRLRQIWSQLEAALQERQLGRLVGAFLNWYIPYFCAYSFPLARQNEFAADACSVRLTSAATTAQALTSVAVFGRYLGQRYWPDIYARAKDVAQPAFGPHGTLRSYALQSASADEVQGWLQAELAEATTYADTHPSLRDRLEAVGADAALVLPADGQGADRLLGERRTSLETLFDAKWRSDIAERWEQHYEDTQEKRRRLSELSGKDAEAPLGEQEAIERAQLEDEVGAGPAVALAHFRDLAARIPESLVVCFCLGRQLLLQNNEEGVALVEGVVHADPDAILAGSELLRDFWWQRGDREKGGAWQDKAGERAELLQRAQAERSAVGLDDRWVPHALDQEQVAELVAQLKRVPGMRAAYLVRKDVAHFPERPLYVLAFRVARIWPFGKAKVSAALERVQATVSFPGQAFIVELTTNGYGYGAKFARCPGSRIL